MYWFRAIDWFVPERVRAQGADAVRRARLAIGSAAVGSLPLLWGAVYQGTWGVPGLGAAAGAAGLGLAALPFLIRASGSSAIVGHGVPGLLATFCVGGALQTGAQATAVLVGAPLVPLAAVLLGGLRSGLLWCGLTCAGLVAVALAAGAGLEAPWAAPAILEPIVGVRAAILASLGAFALAAIHESLRLRALRELGKAHQAAAAARQRSLESETRFRTLMENASDAISEWDASGSILYVNRQVREQIGSEAEAIVGTHWLEHMGRVHPEDVKALEGTFTTILEYEQEAEVALRFRHGNGSWRWLELTIRPFRNADGDLRMVSVSRDVTERREVETLRRLSRELDE